MRFDMPQAAIIFCETAGNWAVAWRRLCNARGGLAALRVIETRGTVQCREEMLKLPAAFAVVELNARNIDRTLSLLQETCACCRLAAMAVVAPRELAPYEWLAREVGAVHFLTSIYMLPSLYDIVERHLERLPAPEQDTQERIWATLPWGRDE
jgi:hypothetical protein